MLAHKVGMRPFIAAKPLAPALRHVATMHPCPSRLLTVEVAAMQRLRLHNLAPAKGSRKRKTRKGRGHSAGQGGTCGFGNNGQKARSGSGVRPGFEGGQTPLYRRLPKLRGIAGGMGAGLPDYVVVNLRDLEKHFQPGQEVTLEDIRSNVLSVSGREKRLPLKVLGTGTLTKPLTVKARAFSETAKKAIEAAGGKAEIVITKTKWTRKAHEARVRALKREGKDYRQEKLKLRVAALQRKGLLKGRIRGIATEAKA